MSYNVPSVTLAKARRIAVAYMRCGIVPFLVAAPGVGKTRLARSIAEEMGARFHAIRLNNVSPEDAAGLQYVDRSGERSVHLPARWMPSPDGSDGPVVVLVDEITQASDDQRKAIMSALLERYLGDAELPDDCYFIAAGNSADDGTNVHEFDRATADRFGVIRVRPDVESWCDDYAPTVGPDVTVAAFLRLRPDCFEMSEAMAGGDDVIGPSPRTWEAVMRFLVAATDAGLDEDETRCGVMGKVGEQVGEAFWAVRSQALQLSTIAELLAMSPEDRRRATPRTLDALWTYAQGLIWHATTTERMREAFDLLDGFEEIDDVPFLELRHNVAETMYQRAISVHRIDDIVRDRELARRVARWKAEIAEAGAPRRVELRAAA